MNIQIGAFLVFLAVAGVAGCLVGILVAASVAGRIVKKQLPDMPAMPEFIAAGQINLIANVAVDNEGGAETRLVMTTTAVELSSIMVERWLEKRDLMMVPKGKDFTVPLKGSHASY